MLNVQRQIFQDKNKFINIISIQKMRDELHKTEVTTLEKVCRIGKNNKN